MSYTTLKSKTVIVRKQRVCWGCGNLYPIATKMQYIVNDFDGFQANYWCIPCHKFGETLDWRDMEDGMCKGDMWEFDGYKEFREKILSEI